MPIISSTAPATANPTPPPKSDTIKPIGICLPTSTNIEIPAVSTASAATVVANLPPGPRNSLNNNSQTNSNSFYPSTTTVSAPGQFQMGPLSVMVAKFTPANPSIASNRQQTVILQPRINTTRAATALQMNPIRGSAVLSSQTLSTALTSTTSSSISVRTRVIAGQNHQANALPMINLSAVTNPVVSANSASASNTTVKQVIKGPKLLSTTNNLETVNLVMTTPSDVRNVRTNLSGNDIKTNMLTVHNINNNNNKVNGPKSVLPGGSTLVAQPKMISINNTGQSTTNMCQRLGILGTGVGGGKSGIINLTTALPKSFIFTAPNATLTGTGSTLANMVSISSANNFVPTGQPTKISVTPNHIIAGGPRPHLVTTTTGTLPPNHNNLLSPKATIYTVATTSANILNSVSSLPSTTVSTVPQVVSYSSISSATVTLSTSSVSTASIVNVKPTILATNLSPVKPPYLQPPTHHQANSPRPRILSRKRLNSDQTSTITLKTANGTALSHPSCNNNASSSVLNIDPKLLPCLGTLTDGQLKSESASTSTVTIPINAAAATMALPDTFNILPRKKPRKQLLEPSSSPKKEFEYDYPIVRDLDVEKETKEKVFYIKRPRPLLRETKHLPYHSASKSAHSLLPHFLHYKDVKPKPDKKVSFTDLLGEVTKPHVGWKINHIAQQLQESSNEEINTMQSTLDNFLTVLEKDISPFSSCASNTTLFGDANANKLNAVDKICVKINDLTRANMQRTRVILDHYKESKQLLLKLTTEHKDKVTGLAKRIGHKRGFVK